MILIRIKSGRRQAEVESAAAEILCRAFCHSRRCREITAKMRGVSPGTTTWSQLFNDQWREQSIRRAYMRSLRMMLKAVGATVTIKRPPVFMERRAA